MQYNYLIKLKATCSNRPFPSCCEPYYESKAACNVFHMKISFVCIRMKTNFHNKNFALSLPFKMRFEANRKWPIQAPSSKTKKIT